MTSITQDHDSGICHSASENRRKLLMRLKELATDFENCDKDGGYDERKEAFEGGSNLQRFVIGDDKNYDRNYNIDNNNNNENWDANKNKLKKECMINEGEDKDAKNENVNTVKAMIGNKCCGNGNQKRPPVVMKEIEDARAHCNNYQTNRQNEQMESGRLLCREIIKPTDTKHHHTRDDQQTVPRKCEMPLEVLLQMKSVKRTKKSACDNVVPIFQNCRPGCPPGDQPLMVYPEYPPTPVYKLEKPTGACDDARIVLSGVMQAGCECSKRNGLQDQCRANCHETPSGAKTTVDC